MRRKNLAVHFVAGMMCLAIGSVCDATTIQTTGAGSAVTSADRTATFDSMTSSNGVNLDAYTENGLRITTGGSSWGSDPPLSSYSLDPFHIVPAPVPLAFYAIAYGNNEWVTIATTDSKRMFGVEFMYGNTWTTGGAGGYYWGNDQAIVDWQTWRSGVEVSSGTIGLDQLLLVGTILGFSDSSGFDELLVRATIANSSPPYPWQAIALDNLDVQLNPVPLPGALPLFATGLGALGLLGWRRKKKTQANAA